MIGNDKMLKLPGQAPICANAMLAAVVDIASLFVEYFTCFSEHKLAYAIRNNNFFFIIK